MQMLLDKIQQAELVTSNDLHSPALRVPEPMQQTRKYLNFRSEDTNVKWYF